MGPCCNWRRPTGGGIRAASNASIRRRTEVRNHIRAACIADAVAITAIAATVMATSTITPVAVATGASTFVVAATTTIVVEADFRSYALQNAAAAPPLQPPLPSPPQRPLPPSPSHSSLPSPQPPLPPSSSPSLLLSLQQRISGHTRSKTVRLSAQAVVQFPAAQEEAPPPPPAESDHGVRHRAGLISMLDKTTLQGMAATNGAVDALRLKKSVDMGGGTSAMWGWKKDAGIPCAFAAMLATRGTSTPPWTTSGRPTPPGLDPNATLQISGFQGATGRPRCQSTPVFLRRYGTRLLRAAGCGDVRTHLAASVQLHQRHVGFGLDG